MNDLTRKLISYCVSNKLLDGKKSYTTEHLCELYCDYNNLHKPAGISFKKFVSQLSIEETPGYTVSVETKAKKESYIDLLNTKNWASKRMEILKRDSHKCQLCLSEKSLQVHHKKYIPGKKPWEYPGEYLITLCSRCHGKFHRFKGKQKSNRAS